MTMITHPPDQKQHQHKAAGSSPRRFLFVLMSLSLATIILCVLVIGRLWSTSTTPGQHPATPTAVLSPHPSPSPFPSPTRGTTPAPTPTASLMQRIDAYIDHLTPTQQIGQLLMLPVYTDGYNAALN